VAHASKKHARIFIYNLKNSIKPLNMGNFSDSLTDIKVEQTFEM
jgi:hypothetical protein